MLFLPDFLCAGRKPRQLRESSMGVVSFGVPAPGACWLTRTSGSSLTALPPSVFQCSALISYQSHTSHSTYTVKALRNITEINKAPKYYKRSKVLSCTHWGEEGGCTNLYIKKTHTHRGKVSCTLMFPLSVLSPFLGSFFMPLGLGEVFRSLSFLTFFRWAPRVGREYRSEHLQIDSRLCRTLAPWRRFSDRIFIIMFNRSRVRVRKKASGAENESFANMFAFCLARSLPGCSLFQPCLSLNRNSFTFQSGTNNIHLEGYTTSVWSGPLYHKSKRTFAFTLEKRLNLKRELCCFYLYLFLNCFD